MASRLSALLGHLAAPGGGAWRAVHRLAPARLDPYLFYTATLVPIVIGVALLGRRPGEWLTAVALSVGVMTAQALAGRLASTRRGADRPRWQLIRLAIPLAYVTAASLLIGGTAVPLISLYVPIVAAAGAIGMRQGIMTASFAGLFFLLPAFANLESLSSVALRGVTLAGVAFVLAIGTRRMVRALEVALTDARSAVATARIRARQIEALDSVNRVLAAGGPSAERIDEVLGVLLERFRYQHVSVYLGDPHRVDLIACRGYPEAIPWFEPSTGIAGRVMRTGQLAFVPDVAAEPEYVPGTIAATSLVTAPLIVDGRFFGVLNVEASGVRRLETSDRALIAIVANRMASAVALGLDRQALADQARLFADIGAFAAAVAASTEVEPLAGVIASATSKVVPATAVAVAILDRSDGRYRIRSSTGDGTDASGRDVVIGEGLLGRAIRDRVTVRDEPGELDSPSPDRDLGVTARHGVGLPFVRDGAVVGAIALGRERADTPFSERELEGLELVARHAALAVANAFLHAEVNELAIRDALTGLYNRRYFDEACDRLIELHASRRLRGPRPLSAIIFDLDHFGVFNKQHGHQVGDKVLRAFADVLRGRFRATDLVARLGGEEFVAILDGADQAEAIEAAEDVRAALAQHPLRFEGTADLQVSVSAGCAQLAANQTREELLRTADVALFMAKRSGRDRVVAA